MILDIKKRNKVRIAEKKTIEYYKSKGIFLTRYGFDLLDSGLHPREFMKIPKMIRNTPDFVAINKGFAFIESKCCGGDFLKLKLDDMQSYSLWNKVGQLVFFLWATKYREHSQVSFSLMVQLIKSNDYKIKVYPDNNKKYFEIPWLDLCN